MDLSGHNFWSILPCLDLGGEVKYVENGIEPLKKCTSNFEAIQKCHCEKWAYNIHYQQNVCWKQERKVNSDCIAKLQKCIMVQLRKTQIKDKKERNLYCTIKLQNYTMEKLKNTLVENKKKK